MMIIDQEKLVDNIIVSDIIKTYPELKKLIETCSPYEVRGKILSVLDPRNDLHYDYKEFHELNLECEELKYLDEIAVTLRNYVRVADVEVEDFGEVMTPINMVEEMLNKLPSNVWSNPNLKWLDPCSGVGTFSSIVVQRLMKGLKKVIPNKNKRYRHIVENMLYVCELQAKNMFIFHCIFDRPNIFELNTFYGSFVSNEFDTHMKDVWGVDTFDIVIANPPYQQGLHIKFFNKCFDILKNDGHNLFIHPSQPFLNKKLTKKSKEEIKIVDIVNQNKSVIELVDGNKIFLGVGFFLPISITYVVKTKSNDINIIYRHFNMDEPKCDVVKSVDDIFLHSNLLVKDIKNKIIGLMNESLEDRFYRKNKYGNIFLKLNKIGGNIPKTNKVNPDFYCPIYKTFENDLERHLLDKSISGVENIIGVNNIEEAENLFSYVKTKFVRFCLSLTKVNQHLDRGEFCFTPFMDLNETWDDNKLYRHFNLTNEEINFIENYISNWYEQDKTK